MVISSSDVAEEKWKYFEGMTFIIIKEAVSPGAVSHSYCPNLPQTTTDHFLFWVSRIPFALTL